MTNLMLTMTFDEDICLYTTDGLISIQRVYDDGDTLGHIKIAIAAPREVRIERKPNIRQRARQGGRA